MQRYAELTGTLCRVLDIVSAICIAAMSFLVVANILMRAVFSRPLTGTMDLVNILMVLAISLGLAHCGLKNGHIAVDFFVERFSDRVRGIIGIMINATAIIFWGAAVWFMAAYARSMMVSNLLAGTVSIPLYPVIFMAAFGILVLTMVIVIKLFDAVRMAVK